MEIRNLIELLVDGYDLENKETIISNCESAYSNPKEYLEKFDSTWLLEDHADSLMNFVIPNELGEILFVGDKIDEIHEQIVEAYPDLEEFPYEASFNALQYFEWMDQYYQNNDINSEILLIGESYGDDLFLIIVSRNLTHEIISASQKFNLKCKRAVNLLKF